MQIQKAFETLEKKHLKPLALYEYGKYRSGYDENPSKDAQKSKNSVNNPFARFSNGWK